ADGITYTSVLPSYCPVKAIEEPSGEKQGFVSMPALVVSRVATPPSRPTVHRSPPYTKAIWVLLTVGFCSRSGEEGAGWKPAVPGSDEARKLAGAARTSTAPINSAPINNDIILNMFSLSWSRGYVVAAAAVFVRAAVLSEANA